MGKNLLSVGVAAITLLGVTLLAPPVGAAPAGSSNEDSWIGFVDDRVWVFPDAASVAPLELAMFDPAGPDVKAALLEGGEELFPLKVRGYLATLAPRKVEKLRGRKNLTVRLSSGGEVVDTVKVSVASGWTPIGGWTKTEEDFADQQFAPCSSTVTWSINKKGSPSGARGNLKKESAAALSQFSKYTTLRFKYVPDYRQATIVVSWTGPDGTRGSSAVGGRRWSGDSTVGFVYMNKKDSWAKGLYGKRLPRKMLMVHEFGHVLGLGHVGVNSIMRSPATVDTPRGLGAGEIEGLKTLFKCA